MGARKGLDLKTTSIQGGECPPLNETLDCTHTHTQTHIQHYNHSRVILGALFTVPNTCTMHPDSVYAMILLFPS